MTYAVALRPSGRPGLGDIPTTNTADVRQYTVGSGLTDPYIDAALEVHGISADAAPRVPAAVKSVLESTGAKVTTSRWGTAAAGTAGKVYIQWKPDKTYNAVDYANIAQRLVQAAAEQFTAGSRIVMPRYRIYRIWPLATLYVYPTGEPVPASAPELAKSTLPGDMPPPSGDATLSLEQQVGGLNTLQIGAIAVGGVAALGLGWWWWKNQHMKPNRRRTRRRSVRRNRAARGISWARSHKDGTVHGRDSRGHAYEIDTSGCYSLYVDGHHVTQFPSLDAAIRAAEKRTALTNNSRQYEYRVIASGRGFHEPEHVPSLEVGQRVASRWSLDGAKNVRLQRRSTYTGAVQTWQTIESISQNPRRNPRFQPGDVVRLTGAFLHSTGQFTGGPINGLVKKPPRNGDMGDPFVYVLWNDKSKPAWVNAHNLELDPTVSESMRAVYRRTAKNPSKPGKHGTLYEYKIRWRDADDDMAPTEFQRVWAYNLDHAIRMVTESAYDYNYDNITILKAERA